MAESLEIYVPLNALAVHSKLADATDPAVVVAAGSGLVDNVARQLGPVEVLLDALKTCRQLLLVGFPSFLQLRIRHLDNASDGRASTLTRGPLTLEVCLNLSELLGACSHHC